MLVSSITDLWGVRGVGASIQLTKKPDVFSFKHTEQNGVGSFAWYQINQDVDVDQILDEDKDVTARGNGQLVLDENPVKVLMMLDDVGNEDPTTGSRCELCQNKIVVS